MRRLSKGTSLPRFVLVCIPWYLLQHNKASIEPYQAASYWPRLTIQWELQAEQRLTLNGNVRHVVQHSEHCQEIWNIPVPPILSCEWGTFGQSFSNRGVFFWIPAFIAVVRSDVCIAELFQTLV